MTNGQIELSDDLAQETFILAWKNIDKFRYEAKFSTWLYRIAFNAWQSEVRKKSEVLMEAEEMPEPASIESESAHIGLQRDLTRAMVDLTDAERERMQNRVEKLHESWKKDREYLPTPTVGKLAELDPGLLVTPPKGLEVGYVPIATRQAAKK